MTGLALASAINSMFEVIRERSTKDEIVFICPQPECGDQSGNRSCNLKTGKTSCWRCNKGGDFVRWARGLGYVIDEDGSSMEVNELDDLINTIHERDINTASIEVKLPHGFIPLSAEPHSAYARLIEKMARRKHLELNDFIRWGVGFTRDDPEWEPFAIFPIKEFGKIVYYQGRTYTDSPDSNTTKRFPNKSVVKFGSKYWVYNIDSIYANKGSTTIVMESILNVISFQKFMEHMGHTGIVPVAVFKHSISKPQEKKILAGKIGEMCFMYDSDFSSNGMNDAKRFSSNHKVSVVTIPTGKDGHKQDPNDNVSLAWEMFIRRRPFSAVDAAIYDLGI